jgi:hypothetical protein
MSRKQRSKHIYDRGGYWLDWDRKKDGTLRSPFLAIQWYDSRRGRICTLSTRTDDANEAKIKLDNHYLRHSRGEDICPTCGQDKQGSRNALVLQAITDYLTLKETAAASAAIRPRLAHVVNYISTLPSPEIYCNQIDEGWIENFRIWLREEPMFSSAGAEIHRKRALSTVENSVSQLAAAITASKSPLRFKPVQTKELNNTPTRRLTVQELSDAFEYATDPRYPIKRRGLHSFLMFSVATMARPDAAHDFSTAPDRKQWNKDRDVICLNPVNRRQTKKYRAAVAAPRQIIPVLNQVDGFLIESISVRSAWDSMVEFLGWPKHGDGGMKLIRRSIAQLVRDAGTKRAWSNEWRDRMRRVPSDEIALQLGHRKIGSVTDLYAMFDPDYLENVTAAIEGVIDAIIEKVPSAFTLTGTVVVLEQDEPRDQSSVS